MTLKTIEEVKFNCKVSDSRTGEDLHFVSFNEEKDGSMVMCSDSMGHIVWVDYHFLKEEKQ